MVKGITRQVVVIKSPDPAIFEQAIFLVRDDVLAEGGISEKTLLQEAHRACAAKEKSGLKWYSCLFWSAMGAVFTALLWLLSYLFV